MDPLRRPVRLCGLGEGRECRVDLTVRAGLQNPKLPIDNARRFLHVAHNTLRIGPVRVQEKGDYFGFRNKLGQQFEPLRVQFAAENSDARQVTAWPGQTGNEAGRDQVTATEEDNRNRRGCSFRGCYSGVPPTTITSTLRSTKSAANAGSRS